MNSKLWYAFFHEKNEGFGASSVTFYLTVFFYTFIFSEYFKMSDVIQELNRIIENDSDHKTQIWK